MPAIGIFRDARYIGSAEGARLAIRRASWFALLHALIVTALAGFVMSAGRPVDGLDHKIVILAAFLCFAAFRVAKGSQFWVCLLSIYEIFNVLFCVLSVRYPSEALFQLMSAAVGSLAWMVYTGGFRGFEYLRQRSAYGDNIGSTKAPAASTLSRD